jgi:lipoate-protein ligase A
VNEAPIAAVSSGSPIAAVASGVLTVTGATGAAGESGATGVALVELPLSRASGDEQMARDEQLLATTVDLTVRRYLWSSPAVSLGKFQELTTPARAVFAVAGIAVVRRPSGGRLVLHGEGFEWSFAVVVPAGLLPYGTHAAYQVVHDAMAAALAACGTAPDAARDEPYVRSALCFSSVLRHDLLVAGNKAVAVAQVRRGDRHLVHGSVLERRPPAALVAAVEAATGESWRADGLAAAGVGQTGEPLWRAFVARLGAAASGSRLIG